jgi:putative two-component system response regulator
VFDALTTRRPYKEAMSAAIARQYLEDKKEHEFDPACVEAFVSRWDEVISICVNGPVIQAPFRKSVTIVEAQPACNTATATA